MRALSLTAIANSFSVEEIEKALIFNFVNVNGIDYLCASPFSDSLQLELLVQRKPARLTKPNMEAKPATAG